MPAFRIVWDTALQAKIAPLRNPLFFKERESGLS
jgi:hypothetical protein